MVPQTPCPLALCRFGFRNAGGRCGRHLPLSKPTDFFDVFVTPQGLFFFFLVFFQEVDQRTSFVLMKANYNFSSTNLFLESCVFKELLLSIFCDTVMLNVQAVSAEM